MVKIEFLRTAVVPKCNENLRRSYLEMYPESWIFLNHIFYDFFLWAVRINIANCNTERTHIAMEDNMFHLKKN